MNKIIAAFDGLRFSESTMEYAIYLARLHDAHLVGVFLSEHTRFSFAAYESLVELSAPGKEMISQINKSDLADLAKSINIFESACIDAKVNYSIHRDRETAANELMHESIFADLMVIDAGETFSYIENSLPGGFIKKILQEARCPVMIVPKNFRPVEELVFLYDGTASAAYAIKQFNYVLPGLKGMKIKVLFAKDKPPAWAMPDNELIKEWMRGHYPGAVYQVLQGGTKELIAAAGNEGPGVLIVSGAYHRSKTSMLFRKSLADHLLNEIQAPLFIAHS